jgi:hypothetical protein
MDRNGDFAQLPVIPPSHKKYVEAFSQMPSFSNLKCSSALSDQGRNSRQSSEVAESLFEHLIFLGYASPLGNGDF